MKKLEAAPKQLKMLRDDASLDVPAQLANAVLDILNYLCSKDEDTSELVNMVKPTLEYILRRSNGS